MFALSQLCLHVCVVVVVVVSLSTCASASCQRHARAAIKCAAAAAAAAVALRALPCHLQRATSCAVASCAVNFDVIQSSGRKLFTFMARLKVIQTANEMKKLHTQDEFKKSTQQTAHAHTHTHEGSVRHAQSCISPARTLLNWEFKYKSVRVFAFQRT